MKMGVLEPYSLDPLRYALNHSKSCYEDYRGWLKYKKNGERYAISISNVDPESPSD